MLLALDYDDTYTRDPSFWNNVITLALQRGHSVICVTMRNEEYEGQDVKDDLQHQVEKIIFTDRKAKHKFVHDLGYSPSVWIDDNPAFIFTNAA